MAEPVALFDRGGVLSRFKRGLLRRAVTFAVALTAWITPASAADVASSRDQVDFFENKVRPVLVQHCYECHSTESKKAKGGLLVDTKDALLKGGDSGPALVPGQPDKSLLVTAIRHADDQLKMPKKKLQQHDIDAVAQWVQMGAPDPRTGAPAAAVSASRYDWEKERQHWAYRPITHPTPPSTNDNNWARSPIDQFVLAKLEAKGLTPVGDADARTLIRRMTFDLIGLPPTPEEVENFTRDFAADRDAAVEKLVDRLLASPRYGERWGRHWMDVIRYADTAGDNSDFPIPQAYLYRNYIIQSFNDDKPYDQFIREQIAGDLLPAVDQAQRNNQVIATGYLALSRRFGSVVDRYPQHLTIEDTLDNLGKTYLGLTISCARCHDHKFDAITQRDYYGLYGMFASTKYAFPGIELLQVQQDFVPLVPKEEVDEKLAGFRAKKAELTKKHDDLIAKRRNLEDEIEELEKELDQKTGEERKEWADLHNKANVAIVKVRSQIRDAAKQVENHEKTRPPMPDAYAVQEGKPTDATLHLKGDPDRPGETVPRRWLELFGAEPLPADIAKTSSGRLQLANWITDPRNPLTARVIANRIWHHHFGSGLVKTPNDFGVRGLPPTHPELLDWLASQLVSDGWSIKKLHKQILLSRVYQLSSEENEKNLAADPANELLWRFSRQRLDAETLRDSLLVLGGNLDAVPADKPHPFPPVAGWKFTQHHPFRASYSSNKRSVYLMTSRLTANPFFQSFDGADPNASTPRRDSSVTTVQALYWMNDPFVHEQAGKLAERLIQEASTDEERIKRAFGLTVQRSPNDDERAAAMEFVAQAKQLVGNAADSEKVIWTSFTRALFRTNELLYVD